jgi:hypothetical protein
LTPTHDREGRIPTYEDYHAYYRAQVHHDEYHLLARAFHRLPALRRLEISEREPHFFSNSERLAGLRNVVEAAACSRPYLPGDCASPAGSGNTSRALTLILAHGAVTEGSLESLTLEGFRWHWLDIRDVRMWHVHSFLNGALRNLRCLRISVAASGTGAGHADLDVDMDLDADVPDPVAAVEVWAMLIGRADGLKRVEVSVGDGRGLSWRVSKPDSICSGFSLVSF